MLSRPSSGRPIDSNVFRPMMSGFPIVICGSAAGRNGCARAAHPPAPMTPVLSDGDDERERRSAHWPLLARARVRHLQGGTGSSVHGTRRERAVESDGQLVPVEDPPLEAAELSSRQRCASALSRALPIPLPLCSGATNRSSSHMPWRVRTWSSCRTRSRSRQVRRPTRQGYKKPSDCSEYGVSDPILRSFGGVDSRS
jgi:hypothetical protein